jgi:hypothetical protein
MSGIYADPRQRAQLWSLLEATWPGIPALFDLAGGHGWPLGAVSTPFVARDSERIVSHVGVLELPVVLAGQPRVIAGIHGVCTLPELRRRGHFRSAMEAAMVHLRARYDAAKLCTDKPWAYEPFGFRRVDQCRFVLHRQGPGGPGSRPVAEADLPWMKRLLAQRAPQSLRFAARDPGWLVGIDGVLHGGGLGLFHRLESLDVMVAWKPGGRSLHLLQVVARELPPLEDILACSPWSYDEVVLWMAPDLLAPTAEPIPYPPDEILMVWGDWPALPPFCVPPLEAH